MGGGLLYEIFIFTYTLIFGWIPNFTSQVVVSKLYSQRSGDLDSRHYRATKALFITFPMLGITYLLTLIGPSAGSSPKAYTIFQVIRAFLLSTQGALVTLPYCYLNTEVQGMLLLRFNRWRAVRLVDSECLSTTRASLVTLSHSNEGKVNCI